MIRRIGICIVCFAAINASFADILLSPPSASYSTSDIPFQPADIPTQKTLGTWLFGVGGGYDWSSFSNGTVTVLNNTGGNSPDLMTLANTHLSSGAEELFAGYRFYLSASNAVTLTFDYEHINQVELTGVRIAQYQDTPLFGFNYSNYGYNISRNLFLLIAKWDFLTFHGVSPFIQGGIGLAANRFSDFYDNSQAFQIVPFPSDTQYDLGSIIGAGMDWQATKNLLFSLAYRYCFSSDAQSGMVSTNQGQPLPNPVQLSNAVLSQQVLGAVSYLFGGV